MLKKIIFTFLLVGTHLTFFSQSGDFVDTLFTKRLNSLNLNIELPYNEIVGDNILLFTHQGMPFAARTLGIFLEEKEYIDSILKISELPQELQYLPLALMQTHSPNKNSVGFWQLPHLVAVKYGLEITDEVDERLDIKKSTAAAVAYLQKLSEKYSDLWSVIIAYANSVPALEAAKIRTHQDKNIWILYQQGNLPNKNIIPDFITSIYLANFYHSHHIKPIEPEKNNDNFTEIPVQPLVMPVQPRPAPAPAPSNNTPQNSPVVKKEDKKKVTYTVKSGDTLTQIAKKYNVSIANIQKWNNLKNDRINIGQKLIIYP